MQYPKIALAILVLPTALALPSTGHEYNGHAQFHGNHEAHKSGQVSSAPFASGSQGAPHGLGNGTASAAAASGTGCGSTSTVIYNPTVTMTVAAGGASAASGVHSSPLAVASSVAPVLSASSATVVAPVVNSPAPVASSPAKVSSPSSSSVAPVGQAPKSVPQSSTTPVSSPSTSVVPSVAAGGSSSAAPVSSAASTAPATSSGSGSGSLSADYCTYTVKDGNQPGTPYTGANYTGGVKGSKRGMVFVAGIPEANALVKYMNDPSSSKISWLGNYFSAPPLHYEDFRKGLEYVPQMYGRQSVGKEWNINKQIANNYQVKHMLSFGEPGTPNPTNYDNPTDGATLYMNEMQPFTHNVTIGAPGCLGGPQDLIWDQEFLCNCKKSGCNVGFVAGHWFDAAAPLNQQIQRCKGTVESYIALAQGKPVWMDNIWAKGTVDEQTAFMKEMIPWLEDNPAIERYGWVSQDQSTGNGFVKPDGSLSSLASTFLEL